jgi:hypothetical protein
MVISFVNKLKFIAGAILIAVGALLSSWLAGRNSAKTASKLKDANAYIKTRKAMDDAEPIGDDPAVLREWLRERGQQ